MWNILDSVNSLLSSVTKRKNKIIICIEGNISSGKSTTVNELKEMFKDNKRVCFLLEPLSIWESIRDNENNNMITKFYGNIKRYAFSFQMMAYISRLNILREALKDNDVEVIITERSLFTDKNVFAKMLFDDNMMEDVEHQIYMKWFDSFINDLPEAKMFYIRTEPDTAFKRLVKRNREGENVSIDYLSRVHKYHDDWLLNDSNVNIFDGNVDITSNERPSQKIAIIIHNLLLSRFAKITKNLITIKSESNNYYDGANNV
jgi:deoxyadenosine/deoxycytidine kinase